MNLINYLNQSGGNARWGHKLGRIAKMGERIQTGREIAEKRYRERLLARKGNCYEKRVSKARQIGKLLERRQIGENLNTKLDNGSTS